MYTAKLVIVKCRENKKGTSGPLFTLYMQGIRSCTSDPVWFRIRDRTESPEPTKETSPYAPRASLRAIPRPALPEGTVSTCHRQETTEAPA